MQNKVKYFTFVLYTMYYTITQIWEANETYQKYQTRQYLHNKANIILALPHFAAMTKADCFQNPDRSNLYTKHACSTIICTTQYKNVLLYSIALERKWQFYYKFSHAFQRHTCALNASTNDPMNKWRWPHSGPR